MLIGIWRLPDDSRFVILAIGMQSAPITDESCRQSRIVNGKAITQSPIRSSARGHAATTPPLFHFELPDALPVRSGKEQVSLERIDEIRHMEGAGRPGAARRQSFCFTASPECRSRFGLERTAATATLRHTGIRPGNPCATLRPFLRSNSTHAATAAAAAGVLALELGDRHSFTVTSRSGASRRYNRFSAAAYEEGLSRIYCGIHFRTAMKIGFWQGGRISHYIGAAAACSTDGHLGWFIALLETIGPSLGFRFSAA